MLACSACLCGAIVGLRDQIRTCNPEMKRHSFAPWRAQKTRSRHGRLQERHLVECCFNELKNFRRIATRYDKTGGTSSPSSPSQPSSCAFDDCQQGLERDREAQDGARAGVDLDELDLAL